MKETNKNERCEVMQIHPDVLKKIDEKMPEDEKIFDLSELFKVFGDSTRMKILFVLLETEACTCDLAEILKMTSSAVSHQLNVLKRSKLVKNRREGKSVFYSLADEHVRTIIRQGIEHVEE